MILQRVERLSDLPRIWWMPGWDSTSELYSEARVSLTFVTRGFWFWSVVKTSFPGGPVVKNPPANAGDVGYSLGREDSLEKEMATHSTSLS